jgi:hypothetical protein
MILTGHHASEQASRSYWASHIFVAIEAANLIYVNTGNSSRPCGTPWWPRGVEAGRLTITDTHGLGTLNMIVQARSNSDLRRPMVASNLDVFPRGFGRPHAASRTKLYESPQDEMLGRAHVFYL